MKTEKDTLIEYYNYLMENITENLSKMKMMNIDDDTLNQLKIKAENIALQISEMINIIENKL